MPHWLHHLEVAMSGPPALRPVSMTWERELRYPHKDAVPSQYRSDPYTYLQYAREMRSFYAAHRREPLFPFATKVWLWLLHDDDSAVSFASAGFSVLAICLTFALGQEAFSYGVGLAAALLWAVEFDVVTSASDGWRDDAFTCAVLLIAWLAIRFDRQATGRRAVALGAAGGLACLVRITSLSLLIPLLVWLVAVAGHGWRLRGRSVGIAAAAALVVAGPYLFNCWRTFGDPLYAINVHANVYRATEGQGDAAAPAVSAREYLAAHLRARPMGTIETVALGLTAYPFANKWHGFDVWLPGLGRVLSMLSLAGLFLLVLFPEGRLLLLVLGTSLVPYAPTWRLIHDWRFTEHAYPFLLIAATAAPWIVVHGITRREALLADRRRVGAALARSGVAAVAVIAAVILVTRVLPPRVFEETLAAGEPATIMAGDGDGAFFSADWSVVAATGTIATRVATVPRAVILLPLGRPADYDLLLRADPSTAPVTAGQRVAPIQLLLNGRLLGTCDSGSTPERIGVCRASLPAGAVRPGWNRLTLTADGAPGFRLWYVRVTRPPPVR
jgi:hypothetical protein